MGFQPTRQYLNFRPFLRKISLFVIKAHKLFFWYLSESYRNQNMNIYRFSNLQCVDSFLKARQPISRVLSFKSVIYLGLNLHLVSSNQPRWLTKNGFRLKAMPSLFGLAPGGVFHAFFVTKKPVRSYRTFSPLPR